MSQRRSCCARDGPTNVFRNVTSALHEQAVAPLARLAAGGPRLGHTVHKELLRRRGVIRNAALRAPADPLDALTRRELDALCERLGIG